MLKQTVSLGKDIQLLKLNLKKQVAQVVAGMVQEEFEALLFDAPQRSGNYVANMAVAAGGAGGRKGGQLYFPLRRSTEQLFARGNLPAVMKAMEENKNILRNVTTSITRGTIPQMTIYNRLHYADIVEGFTEDQLRDVNKAGAHAMTKAGAKLEIRANQYVADGSPLWEYYINKLR